MRQVPTTLPIDTISSQQAQTTNLPPWYLIIISRKAKLGEPFSWLWPRSQAKVKCTYR